MSDFIERLRSAVYRSPSGTTFTLQFDTVERSGGKKAAVHEFPQQDTASVQDLGNQTERLPMAVYFTGSDFDQQADSFWAALSERGPGSLQHPRYGDIPVLPLSWAQTESWVDGLGRADFKVEFVRVQAQVVFPITSVAVRTDVSSAVTEALESSNAEAAADFDPVNAADVTAIRGQITSWLADYTEAFDAITAVSESVQAEANRYVNMVTDTLDELIAAPAELFGSLATLAALPATVVTNVVHQVDAYRSQIVAMALRVPETYSQALAACQTIYYALGGIAVASTIGTVSTRGDAIASAEAMADIVGSALTCIEAMEASVPGFRASPATIGALLASVNTASANLLAQSYSLKAERRVTLATERTPLDLIAEFYGDDITDLDEALDEFITTNDLQGDEIMLVPAGREVVYYG
jgi:prophage DNA circulation protein